MASTQDIIFAVLFSVVLVFNIAGNSLVIYTIIKERGTKTSTKYLLLNLAVADLLFGVFLAPEYIFLPFFRDSVPSGVLGDWLCRLVLSNNIAWMASRASIFTMVCLSVERYFAVCRPHTFSQRFSPKIVKVLVLVSWIYAAVVVSPTLFDAHAKLKRDHYDCYIDISTKFYSSFILIESVCNTVFMVFLLFKIFISLWCKQTVEFTGEREIAERKKKKKVTLSVLAVLGTFIVCWIPTYICLFVFGASNSLYFTTTVLVASGNAAVDPYLFTFQSSRFKSLVKKLLCCRKASS